MNDEIFDVVPTQELKWAKFKNLITYNLKTNHKIIIACFQFK